MITEKIASSSRDIRIIGNDLQLKFGERLEVWGTADGVKQVIVHINSTSFFKVVRRIGVDAVISKNSSAVNEVLKIIRSDEDKLTVSRFDEIDIESLEIIVRENSEYLRKELRISDLPSEICLAAIKRNDKIIIPIRNTDLKIGDELLFFTKSEDIYKAEQLF